jgi:hypothetical protein
MVQSILLLQWPSATSPRPPYTTQSILRTPFKLFKIPLMLEGQFAKQADVSAYFKISATGQMTAETPAVLAQVGDSKSACLRCGITAT